jgi:hypothetical protein
MRNDLIEGLCIGGCIGLAIVVMHALTSSAAPQVQLLVLLAAAVVIAAGQVLFSSWRNRQGTAPRSQASEPAPSMSRLRRNRRNPFFRELTRDWTGLDEYAADDDAIAGSAKAPAEPNGERAGRPRRP